MKKQGLEQLQDHMAMRLFIAVMQEKYSQAMQRAEPAHILEAAAALTIAYVRIGNVLLAQKWADEFWARSSGVGFGV